MLNGQPRIRPLEWDAKNSLGFGVTNGSPNIGKTIRPTDSQEEKEEPAEQWTRQTENLSRRIRRTKFLGILRYNQIS